MSLSNAIKATENGKPVPENAPLSTPFLLHVAIGDAYFRDGKRRRVLEKDFQLDANGDILGIGLIIQDA